MTEPNYNRDETHVLRLSRLFDDMTSTEGWKEYEKVLRAQIKDRELLVGIPISTDNPAFAGMDFTTRVAAVEVIKGALIGLNLALSLPSATMKHAKDIVTEHSPKEKTDAS